MKRNLAQAVLVISALTRPSFSFILPPDEFPLVSSSSQDATDVQHPQVADAVNIKDDNSTPLPVVVWHGLGDSATAEGMQDIAALITEVHPGTYVHIISASPDPAGDRQASWFGNVTTQLDLVCETLANDRILSTAPAIDAIGFSQGGQFLRAYQQRCGNKSPRIRNLLTFGSQHNGIAEFQRCAGPTDFICQAANALLRGNAVWSSFIQSGLVPAQYYRGNPADETSNENFLEHSNFLADINNERARKNKNYARNLAALEKFVMVIFRDDKTVIPKESGWFAEVDAESGDVTDLRNRLVYKEDWLGLKKLDDKGGLVFESVPGEHMRLDEKDLRRLFGVYLGPATATKVN